jgi:uncharacterized membrane protein
VRSASRASRRRRRASWRPIAAAIARHCAATAADRDESRGTSVWTRSAETARDHGMVSAVQRAPADSTRPTDLERWIAVGAWLAVLALGAWSAWQRWQVMESSPYPIGIDGYYYPIQLRSLLERGHLAYPASPLALWLMWPLAALSDPITGAKLGAALGGAAVVVPAFLVGRRLAGPAGGLAGAVAAVATGGSFYLSFEFVKNGVGLTLALTAIWLALRAVERPDRGRIAATVAAIVATALTHKLAIAVVAVVLAPMMIVAVRRRAGARAARGLAAAAAALVAIAIVLGLAMPARFLGARELDLAGRALTADADWSLPALVVDRGPARPPLRVTIGEQTKIAAGVLLALAAASLAALALARRARPPAPAAPPAPLEATAVVVAAAALVAITVLPWLAVDDPDGLGFRLRTSVFAPLAIVAAALVGRVAQLARLDRRAALLVVVPALAAWLAVRPPSSTDGLVRAHPAMVAAMRAARGALPADAVVVTIERHLGFQLAWYARVPVRMRPDPVPPARRWRMIPGNVLGFGSPLDRALDLARATPGVAPPLALHPRHPSGLLLVPEATWQWALARLPPRDAAWWRAWHTI